jgi:hypothetical protein
MKNIILRWLLNKKLDHIIFALDESKRVLERIKDDHRNGNIILNRTFEIFLMNEGNLNSSIEYLKSINKR